MAAVSKAREAARKAKTSAARRAARLKEAESMFPLHTCQLVGGQHCGSLEVQRLLELGEELDLVREPDNVADGKAVRLDLEGLKLGYVPAAQNELVSRMLDANLDVRAFVVGKNDRARFPQEFIRVGLYVNTAE